MKDLIERYEYLKRNYPSLILAIVMLSLAMVKLAHHSPGDSYMELYPWENTIADALRVAGHNTLVFLGGHMARVIAVMLALISTILFWFSEGYPRMPWLLNSMLLMGLGIAVLQWIACFRGVFFWL